MSEERRRRAVSKARQRAVLGGGVNARFVVGTAREVRLGSSGLCLFLPRQRTLGALDDQAIQPSRKESSANFTGHWCNRGNGAADTHQPALQGSTEGWHQFVIGGAKMPTRVEHES